MANFYSSDTPPIVDLRAYLEIEQAKRIIDSAVKPRNKLLLSLLANTGRRISEALLLKPSDIDYKNEVIYWNILKRKKPLIKPIATNRRLLLNIKAYINMKSIENNKYVFFSTHRLGKPINRHRAYQLVQKYAVKAGIPKVGTKNVHPHTFRHSFCVWGARRLKSPRDLVLLKELAGHARIETTMRYLVFAPVEMKDLVNKLPDFMQLGVSDEEIDDELKEPKGFDFTKIGEDTIIDL